MTKIPVRAVSSKVAQKTRSVVTTTVAAHSVHALLLQLLAAFAVLYAISWYNIPAALAVGGVAAIYAVQSHPDDADAKRDAALAAKARGLVDILNAGAQMGHDTASAKAVADNLTED